MINDGAAVRPIMLGLLFEYLVRVVDEPESPFHQRNPMAFFLFIFGVGG